ncbi:MAG: NAD(+)--rifampin ADP-ribosyltransferase [Planctomycetales bacterium]|nr:NAD(+)--rifampin ADP-ribosyltransferase [Planctomycetales bacterium]
MSTIDSGPFFHGTRADLAIGTLLTAGFRSNYRIDVVMNHIYFSALPKVAGLAAEIAMGDGHSRVYIVKPTGPFENDPNVTDRKFPGNPTRSYRSKHPLAIVGELSTWEQYEIEFIDQLRSRIANGSGEIIN